MENVTLQIHAGYLITIPLLIFANLSLFFPIISPSLIPSLLILFPFTPPLFFFFFLFFFTYTAFPSRSIPFLFYSIIHGKPTFSFTTSLIKNSSFSSTFYPLFPFFPHCCVFSDVGLYSLLSSPTGSVLIHPFSPFFFLFLYLFCVL